MSRAVPWAAACAAMLIATGAAAATNNAADQDFGKLSQDGFTAMRDIRMARLAIFDGNTTQAKTDADQAQAALQKAQSDDAVFTKAESDLKAPAGVTQKGSGTASTTPIKWLPVDGAFTLGEDYVATPEKRAAMSKADAQMKQGDHKDAMEALKLAHVDVTFDVEVAPLEKTIAGLNKAVQLIDQGQYFEANQALKTVEDGTRYDVEELIGTPKKMAQKG